MQNVHFVSYLPNNHVGAFKNMPQALANSKYNGIRVGAPSGHRSIHLHPSILRDKDYN